MKKIVLILIIALSAVSGSYAQYDTEILKYSQSFLQADARSLGVGNAFGAVGANFVSSSINPAGLALFRKGEFFFSAGFANSSTTSEYLNNTTKSGKSLLSLPSIGLVFTDIKKQNGVEVENGWVSQTFAMGLNRTNSFSGRQNYSGINDNNSILDYFTESATGKYVKDLPYLTKMAYEIYLIDHPKPNDKLAYINALDDDTFGIVNISQERLFSSRGSAYDMNFAFAANYSNRFFLGAKLGIPFFDYYKNSKFTENNNRAGKSNYLGMTHESDVNISAIGFNAALGLIYKPIDYLRLGFSLQSPTFYRLSENYTDKLTGNFDTMESKTYNQKGLFEYSSSTPFKATLSMAIIAGTYGFISVDYEYIDFTKAYLSSNDYSFNFENNNIQEFFKPTSNIRAGGELKLGIFAIRAGYAYYPSPYNSQYEPEKGNRAAEAISLGFGIREKDYYLDFGLQNITTDEFELPYASNKKDVKGAVFSNTYTNFIGTLGFKF